MKKRMDNPVPGQDNRGVFSSILNSEYRALDQAQKNEYEKRAKLENNEAHSIDDDTVAR